MAEWAAKRFWTNAGSAAVADGWRVLLDGRGVRTPADRPLILPTEALAEAVAAEWDGQDAVIEPATMPMTRMANSALDKVEPQREAVVEMLSAYGETDLLSYRADRPAGLARRQAELWDPLLDWAAERFGGRLSVTEGVMPITQSEEVVAGLAGSLRRMPSFRLAAFHDLVVLTGSLVLAHAVVENRLDGAGAWSLSRVDEAWQAAEWGRDAEAEAVADRKFQDLLDAELFWSLAG